LAQKLHVAVVGAGAFGGWTALHLLRRGLRITLLDAWGPGNSRASSGGETRIIRATYGPEGIYTRMAARGLQLWKEHEARWGRPLFKRTGVLWMANPKNDGFARSALPHLREAGIPHQELSRVELEKRWPQINFEGITWGIHEPEAGFLFARMACQAVLDAFLAEGGEYKQAAVLPFDSDKANRGGLQLSDGTALNADQYVFACGPWLKQLFPELLGGNLKITKQEVFFFGTPAGDDRFSEAMFPAWADLGGRFMYGIPGNQARGFKIADDTRGPEFDPTSGERAASPESLRTARAYLAFRFPALKGAPLLETRVCQYENTPDHHFIADRHPEHQHIWLVGGGSGHGFKHGPAIGEMMADLVTERMAPNPIFGLARFRK